MQKGDDPYEILGVAVDAETSEIRKAYRKLAIVHHPDKQPTEEGREKAHHVFAKIACAYELLSDDVKRKEYDEQQDDDDDDHHGFDGNATYDYDYPMDPSRNAGSTDLAKPTEKTGKSFNPFRRKKKGPKPMHFSDPYEVFKRAFKEEYGYEYPGAKWDNIEPDAKDIHNRGKHAPLAIENGPASGGGGGDDKKGGGGILTLFKGKKKDNQLAVYKGDGKSNNKEPYKQPPGNNRPSSMETKTTQIEHPDGTVETITETTITRPDGSTESMRTTDMPEKNTHNWTKPKEDAGAGKKNLKQLTSGKEGQKMLTNGKDNKKKGKDKKKTLAITNG